MFIGSREFPKVPKLIEEKEDENIFVVSTLNSSQKIFQTDQSLLLKYALDNNIPSKYVFKYKDNYISLFEFVKLNIFDDFDIIYEKTIKYIPIEERDIAFFLFEIQGENEELLSILPKINPQYKNLEFFKNQFNDWKETNILSLNSDKLKYEEIISYLDSISQIDPLVSSDIHVTKYSLQFSISSKKIKFSEINLSELGPDIFANSIATNLIPYIRLNDNESSTFKIFTGETFEQRPQFKLFETKTYKFKNKNTIYFILLSSKSDDKQVKESYTYASLDLLNRKLNIKFFPDTSKNINEILKIIKNSFPDLEFTNKSEKSFNGFFKIYNITAREDSFLDMITNTFFNKFLFIDESETNVADVKKIKIFFDTKLGFLSNIIEEPLSQLSSLSSSVTQYISGVNDSSVSTGKYEIVNFPPTTSIPEKIIGGKDSFIEKQFLSNNTPYILVNITKAKNRFDMYQFSNFMTRFMNVYDQQKNNIQDEYQQVIPDLKKEGDKLIMFSLGEKESQQSGKIPLQLLSPEIFSGDYSRDCGFQNQPIIIDPQQKVYWENKKIKDKDTKKIVPRPTLDYGGLSFVCPGETYPFVGLKQKKTVIDENFQFYPCCYSKPQKEIKQRIVGKSKRTNEPIKTKKIVAEEGLGFLPSNTISDYLYGVFNINDPIYRMGTLFSPSSVLSALLLAQNNKYYLSLNSNQKINYITELRKSIGNNSDFELTSSELFDMKIDNRKKLFLNTEEFLDPSLFYRILEETFNLNIFIISGTKPEPNLEAKYTFDTYRYSSIPMHSYTKYRKNVILFKHWGSESDNLPHPHLELIVVGEEQNTLFDETVGNYLLQGYYLTTQIHGRSHIVSSKFEVYDFKTIETIIKGKFIEDINIVSQILDNKGKCRVLRIKINNFYITISIPPIPPLNLPVSNVIDIHDYQIIRKIFVSEPIAYSKESSNFANGLWYPLYSTVFGIFIPINKLDITDLKSLSQGIQSPLSIITTQNKTERLIKLTKDIKFLNQIIRFCFNIFRLKSNIKDNSLLIKDFFKKYVNLSESDNNDSSLFYNFIKLPRLLPYQSKNIEDALLYFKKYVPELVNKDAKLNIYSKNLWKKLYESIEYYLSKSKEILIPHFLSQYYITENDFPYISGNIIFFSEDNANNWIKRNINETKSIYDIQIKLKKNLWENRTPFLFSPQSGLLCLIQNVLSKDSFQKSLNICSNWEKNGINNIPENLENIQNGYKVFTISKDETLELLETNLSKDGKYYYIIKYPETNQYAALLPL
jgi:hypothetical protein